jgi:release factor glutamine methyltransferase
MSDDVERRAALALAATWGVALALATDWLREAQVGETPALDAQILLARLIGVNRARLLAYPERPLMADEATRYAALVAARADETPIAYLIGEREFMGLTLRTDRRALIPRPETELLVEAALRDVAARLARDPQPPLIVDIGTGSGAIAIALAAGEPRLTRIYATDISPDALELARENAQATHVAERITFLLGDLLEPLPEAVDLLLANLPYIAPGDPHVPRSVSAYEPAQALYGADDGLGHIRRLLAQAPEKLRPGAALYLEFGYNQGAAITYLARAVFPDAEMRIHADYAGWDRYIEIHLHG